MSENSVIFLTEINSSQADKKSAVQAAVPPSPFVVPEENVAGERGVGVSGYESDGFPLSEILRRKGLEKNVSEGVVDTAHLPQCEFSNFHQLTLALLLEFVCWPVSDFYLASFAARAGT